MGHNPAMAQMSRRSGHGGAIAVSLVLATIAAFAAIYGLWLNRQALSTRGWTNTSSHLIANNEVRGAVADVAQRELFAAVHVDRVLGSVLPSVAAGPAERGLAGLARRLAGSILASRAARTVWRTANQQAHRQLLEILADRRRGPVYLDLTPLLGDLVRALDSSAPVAAIPGASSRLFVIGAPHAGRLQVLSADQVDRVRGVVNAVRRFTVALCIAAAAWFALAVVMARGWPAGALAAVGCCAMIAGAAALGARALLGSVLSHQLVPASEPLIRRGTQAAWLVGSSQLRTLGLEVAVAGGVVMFVGLMLRALPWSIGVRRPG